MTTMRNLTNRNINFTRTLAVSLTALVIAAMLNIVCFAASSSGEPATQAAQRDDRAAQVEQQVEQREDVERQATSRRCNLRTISGSYGSNITGTFFLPPPSGSSAPPTGVPLASVGRLVFDGIGTVSGTDTNSFGGTISVNNATGTYTVNDDCTGTLNVTFPNGFTITNNLVIVDGGKEFFVIQTNPGTVITGVFKRQ